MQAAVSPHPINLLTYQWSCVKWLCLMLILNLLVMLLMLLAGLFVCASDFHSAQKSLKLVYQEESD